MSKLPFACVLFITTLILMGCAEGPFWRQASYFPWAQDKWRAEEELADTLFEKKRELDAAVASAIQGTAAAQSKVSNELGEVVQRDPILLLRLHAVELLSQLNTVEANTALELAGRDPDSRVRIAAIQSWAKKPENVAVRQLHEILGSDTDVDVRLAATRALGQFQGRPAIEALSLALTDSDPAIQYRATDSLAKVTGKNFGADVTAWQSHIGEENGLRQATATNGSQRR